MSKHPKTNRNAEILLRIEPTKDEHVYTIYDITAYFPDWPGEERDKYMKHVKHSITGRNGVTIHIHDFYECISKKLANNLAKEFYNGNLVDYRLD